MVFSMKTLCDYISFGAGNAKPAMRVVFIAGSGSGSLSVHNGGYATA